MDTATLTDLNTFALAGHAIFTVESRKTSTHFTYKVTACDDKPGLFLVGVLTGPDNTSEYTYLGTIRQATYAHGRKSRIGSAAPSAVAFAWVWERRAALPECVKVCHAGRCGRCARLLTVGDSVEAGFGKTCLEKMGA